MHLFIITGTSKGLGHSLMQQSLAAGDAVLSISRSEALNSDSPFFSQLRLDLKDLKVTESLHYLFEAALFRIPNQKIEAYHLVNNAAVLEPVGQLEDFSLQAIREHLAVNLEAPIFLSQIFLQSLKSSSLPLTVTNISSGAADSSIPGWSMYCTTKSGLKMLTDCLNKDFGSNSNRRALSFSPGVMDTEMQAQIRSKTDRQFSQVQKFKDLKEAGQLLSPELVAQKLLRFLKTNKDFSQIHYKISDLMTKGDLL